jgi:hypothetical protein
MMGGSVRETGREASTGRAKESGSGRGSETEGKSVVESITGTEPGRGMRRSRTIGGETSGTHRTGDTMGTGGVGGRRRVLTNLIGSGLASTRPVPPVTQRAARSVLARRPIIGTAGKVGAAMTLKIQAVLLHPAPTSEN